jgi:4'-phosphopantetheinyl transferase
MVYVYIADISVLPDPLENTRVMNGLPIERQKKIRGTRQKKKRLQSLGAGLLLNLVLHRYDISVDALRTNENGKPIVEGICFNLSHSGDYVICAVSEKPVGCDIEKIKEAPKQVEKRAFSPEENSYLKQFSGDAYNREFFRLWTKKESFLKMKGVGIRVCLQTLEMTECYFKEYDIPGYQVTVCAEETEFADMCWETI